jgi:cytochrome c biogenesis protein ResB
MLGKYEDFLTFIKYDDVFTFLMFFEVYSWYLCLVNLYCFEVSTQFCVFSYPYWKNVRFSNFAAKMHRMVEN